MISVRYAGHRRKPQYTVNSVLVSTRTLSFFIGSPPSCLVIATGVSMQTFGANGSRSRHRGSRPSFDVKDIEDRPDTVDVKVPRNRAARIAKG